MSTENIFKNLKKIYLLKIDDSIIELNTKDFVDDLQDFRQVDFSYTIKAKFKYICEYFEKTILDMRSFRIMMSELRAGTQSKGPLNYETANKYILVGEYIARYLSLPFLKYKEYPRFRKDVKSQSKGDMISDDKMRRICECYIKHGLRNGPIDREKNLVYTAALTIMRFTGMPPDDIVNLKWSDDKLTHFHLIRLKTGEERIVPIVPQMRKCLDRLKRYPHGYIIGFKKGPVVEKTIKDEIQRRAKKLGYKEWITCYSFRYSMITPCYLNATEKGQLPAIAHISGHTIQTALKHYNKHDVGHLTDVLMATHPGLKKTMDIDTIKRTTFEILKSLYDLSPFEIDLIIRLKEKNVRSMKIS